MKRAYVGSERKGQAQGSLWAIAVTFAIVTGCMFRSDSGGSDGSAVGTEKAALVGVRPDQSLISAEGPRLVSTPDSNCLILGNGSVKCWGANTNGVLGFGSPGLLGIGTTASHGGHPGEMGTMLPAVQFPTGLTARALAAGYRHVCALMSNTSVMCWGDNSVGELGVDAAGPVGDQPGEMGNALKPAALGRPARSLACGFNACCAILNDGGVKCWGANDHGQLGQGDAAPHGGSATASLPEVSLGAGRKALAIAMGEYHACAILDTGSVKCWGNNADGELGIGSTVPRGAGQTDAATDMGDALPSVPLGTGRTAMAIAAGATHTCAILDNGQVKCWGGNGSGQLGYEDTADRGASGGITSPQLGDGLLPVSLGTGRSARSIIAGAAHTCAVLDDGSTKCWGYNGLGQLGTGDGVSHGTNVGTMGANLPALNLGTLRTARAISAGFLHTCAWLDDGSVKCWGYNGDGELGIGTLASYGTQPSTLGDNLPPVYLREAVSTGPLASHNCAILDDGSVRCWGRNDYGELGLGDTVTRGTAPGQLGTALPKVPLARAAIQVATGGAHTCALLDNGTVECWGFNGNGELGLGNTNNVGDQLGEVAALQPIDLGTDSSQHPYSATAITAGGDHTCALLNNGSVKCWGLGDYGQLGEGNTLNTGDHTSEMGNYQPPITLGQPAKAIVAGGVHTCAVLSDGSISCWGNNAQGQLGVGTVTNQLSPQPVTLRNGTTALSVVAGYLHTCALLSGGTVQCWGYGFGGILGQGNTSNSTVPVAVPLTGTAIALSAAGGDTCAVMSNGHAECWGVNGWGELGLGDTSPRGDNPGEVAALTGISLGTAVSMTALGSSSEGFCTILEDESLKCWGGNSYGQLGLGDTNNRGDNANEMSDSLPLIKLGINRSAIAIATGAQHQCAILENGPVKCWGVNNYGQLGLGDTATRGASPATLGDGLPPVQLGSGRTARQLWAGANHTCALLDSGAVKCWGDNASGQLGVGDVNNRGDQPNEMNDNLPSIDPGTGHTIFSMAAGSNHTCALLDGGAIKCWGANSGGALGIGDVSSRGDDPNEMGANLPTVALGTNLTARGVAAGDSYTCALLNNACVKCWGTNNNGNLGTNGTTNRGDSTVSGHQMSTLPAVSLGNNALGTPALSMLVGPSCAVFDDGSIKCWGDNTVGAAGTGDTVNRGTAASQMGTKLPFVLLGTNSLGTTHTVVALAATAAHRCAILDDGTLKCWGNNTEGELGIGSTVPNVGRALSAMGDGLATVSPSSSHQATRVSVRANVTCALLDDGTVKCWGDNASGHLGEGSTAASIGSTPGSVGDSLPVIAVGDTAICNGGPLPCNTSTTACAPGTVIDDGNPCTKGLASSTDTLTTPGPDTCDPQTGVHRLPLVEGTSCDDGNACNGVARCDGSGRCLQGTAPTIDDGNPCTTDSCNTTTGAVTHTATTGATCNDNNACTTSDKCTSAGVCTGTPVSVDDGNPCTADSCDAKSGTVSHSNMPAGPATGCSSGQQCDGLGHCTTPLTAVSPVTSAPGAVPAPALPAGPTTFQNQVSFLTSAQQASTGAVASAFDSLRIGVVRGVVVDASTTANTPRPNITVTVAGQPGLGQATTRPDGSFDIIVNGGGPVTLRFDDPTNAYLPSDRQIYVPWHDYAILDDVVGLLLKPVYPTAPNAPFDGSGNVSSTAVSGEQPAALMVPASTCASLTTDGSFPACSSGQQTQSQHPTGLTIVAKEYTAGANGHIAMPADLPKTSAFTYAVDFRAQEADGNGMVATFDPPLPFYAKALLSYDSSGNLDPSAKFTPGDAVPVGRYDRDKGAWIPRPNGVVVKMTGIGSDGKATLITNAAANTSGVPDNGASFVPAISDAERTQLAAQFAGQQFPLILWRVMIDHFSGWDLNWAVTPPACDSNGACPGASLPPPSGGANAAQDPDCKAGSIIECQSQALGERIDVEGTPFTLNYRSSRGPGYTANNTIQVPLTGPLVNSGLATVRYHIDVAGKRYQGELDRPAGSDPNNPPLLPANQSITFTWDGRDGFLDSTGKGRLLTGPQQAWVTVEEVYPAKYALPGSGAGPGTQATSGINGTSGGGGGGFGIPAANIASIALQNAEAVADRARNTIIYPHVWSVNLGSWDARTVGLGGWTLNVHHTLYPETGILFRGDGTWFEPRVSDATIELVAGSNVDNATSLVDGQLATAAALGNIQDVAVSPDGQVYFASTMEGGLVGRINMRDGDPQQGEIFRVAGGNNALLASLSSPKALSFGPDGSLYFSDSGNRFIRKIVSPGGPNPVISIVAGNGNTCASGDRNCLPFQTAAGTPSTVATQVPVGGIIATTVMKDGSLILANGPQLLKVDPQGQIAYLAGSAPSAGGCKNPDGSTCFNEGDCGLASLAELSVGLSNGNGGLALAPDGTIYLTEVNQIRRIGTDGMINSITGVWNAQNIAVPAGCSESRNGGRNLNEVSGSPLIPEPGVKAGAADFIKYWDLDTAPNGDIFFINGANIQKIDATQIVTTIAGHGVENSFGATPSDSFRTDTGLPATVSYIDRPLRLALAPDGTVYFIADEDSTTHRIYRVRTNQTTAIQGCDQTAASASGDEVYCFAMNANQQLQHTKTFSTKAGVGGIATPLYSFAYDSNGFLSSVTDNAGNVTTIGGSGTSRTITAPNKQVTILTLDSSTLVSAHATQLKDQVIRTFKMAYDATSGLLKTYTDARSNVFNFVYDGSGRLQTDTAPWFSQGTAPSPLPLQRLSRTDRFDPSGIAYGYDITHTSALGSTTNPPSHQTVYSVTNDASGAIERTTTSPDGLVTKVVENADGTVNNSYPDGTKVDEIVAGDPSFGFWSTYDQQMTVTIPSSTNLVLVTQTARSSSVGTSGAVVQTDTTTINPSVTPVLTAISTFDGTTTPYPTLATTSPGGKQSVISYDAQGRVIAIDPTHGTGLITPINVAYFTSGTGLGKPQTITQGTRTWTLAYAPSTANAGYLASATLAPTTPSQKITYTPDGLGRVKTAVFAGTTTSATWDGNDNMLTLTPPAQSTTSGTAAHAMVYNAVNLLTDYKPPLTSAGEPTTYTHFDYNPDRQLLQVTLPVDAGATRNLQMGYDPNSGRLITVTMPEGTVALAYYPPTPAGSSPCSGCSPGRVNTVTYSPSATGATPIKTTYSYAGPLVTSVGWSGPVTGSVNWTYNNLLQPVTESAAGATASFTFGGDGEQTCGTTSTTAPCPSSGAPSDPNAMTASYNEAGLVAGSAMGAVTDQYCYNQFGEIAAYSASVAKSGGGSTVLYQEILDSSASTGCSSSLSTAITSGGKARDAVGHIIRKAETLAGTATNFDYTYDSLNRLSTVKKANVLASTYGYDNNGNRTTLVTPTIDATGIVDAQDRLLSYGQYDYTYTDNGELLTRTDTANGNLVSHYTYDTRGNLTQITFSDGRPSIVYTIDGQNRRIAKSTCTSAGTCTVKNQWIYRDGLRVAAEFDGTGNLLSRFVYVTNRITPDFMVHMEGGSPKLYRIVSDHLGSPRYVMSITAAATVTPVWSATYDEYGIPTITNSTTLPSIPVGFAGGLYDADMGPGTPVAGLVRFGARDYDPTTGRWTNKDPILFRGGQANLYVYVGNDPVNLVDFSGRGWEDWVGGSAAAAGGFTVYYASELAAVAPFVAWTPIGWGLVAVGSGFLLYDIGENLVGTFQSLDKVNYDLSRGYPAEQSQSKQIDEYERLENDRTDKGRCGE